MKNNSLNQYISIVAVALGLLTYIAVDSGLIKKMMGTEDKSATSSAAVEVQKYSEELRNIESVIQKKKAEVEDIQSRLAGLNISVKMKNRDLAKIMDSEENIKNRSGKIRKISANSHFQKDDFLDSVKSVSITSIGDIQAALDRFFPNEGKVEADSAYEKDWMQFSFQQPYSEGSVFLRSRGLYWSQLISKAAKVFETSEILVGYHGGQVEYEKAQVLKKYLSKISDKNISVDLKHLPEQLIKSQSQVDVFMKKTARSGLANENQ